MIDPGSTGDWLQATLLATALGALAFTGRWALHREETDQATARVPASQPPASASAAAEGRGR
jgi:hypothetical protein